MLPTAPPVPPPPKSQYPKLYPRSQSASNLSKVTCSRRDQRHVLDVHESHECPCRPYTCQYCNHSGTYGSIIGHHYSECQRYPVPCTNYCIEGEMFERGYLQYHLENECPLRPVECEYKWAGCYDMPLCQNLEQHNIDAMADHLALVHIFCSELQKENDSLARENESLREKSNHGKKKTSSKKKL